MIEFIPLDMGNAEIVVKNIWDRGREEAMVFGIEDEGGLLDYIYSRRDDRYAYIVIADDKPIAAMGVFRVDAGIFRTWFIATDDFVNNFMAITRKIKYMMEHDGIEDGITGFETFSACTHKKTEKWFKVLGLIKDNDYPPRNGISRFFKRLEI